MKQYTTRDVARMLDLPVGRVRSFARAGFLEAERGPRGRYHFSFRDLVLLRKAKGLVACRIPPARVERLFRGLRAGLPPGLPLSGLQIQVSAGRVLARHGEAIWNAESGQAEFDFGGRAVPDAVATHAAIDRAETGEPLTAEAWYALGFELETDAPTEARRAYRRAIRLDPDHVDARVNLGRLEHEAGHLQAAEKSYRDALDRRPEQSTALFNLGVCLEDQGRGVEAIDVYRQAIRHDPEYADAYYNLARLLEKAGNAPAALRYLKIYRQLSEEV